MFLQLYPDPYWYGAYSVALLISWIIFCIVWFGIGYVCARFVYKDARRSRIRGMPAKKWALIVFLTGILGLVVYLLMKNAKY